MSEVDKDGNWSAPVRALERDYHLSYPFIFEWESRLYMIPETTVTRQVELYLCTEFHVVGFSIAPCLMAYVRLIPQ